MRPSSLFHLQRSLIHIGIFLSALILSMIAISKSNYKMLAALIGVLFLPILIQSPAWLMMLVVGLFGTELTLPVLPSSLSLHSALAALLTVWLIFRRFITQGDPPVPTSRHTASSLFLFLFLCTLVAIISVRGTGMRYFGSEEWGGGRYFILLIAAAFFWTVPLKSLTEKQWKWAFVLLTLGYLVPFLSQLMLSASGGRVDISAFARPALSEAGSIATPDLEQSLTRIYALAALGTATGLAGLVLFPVRFPYTVPMGLLLMGALYLVSLAGYRSHFLLLAGTVTLYSFLFREKRPWGRHLLLLLLLAVSLWSLLYLVIPHLPMRIQRTFSIIPGIGVSEIVEQDATSSITWRIELWRFSYLLSTPFRWLGRGFLFSPEEVPEFDYTTGFLYMYIRHSYHNGPLSLLIDTGIPGLILCTAFFIAACVESARLLDAIPSDTPFGRAYRVLYSYLVILVIYFYTVIGDPVASVTRVLFIFALLKLLVHSHRVKVFEEHRPPPAPAALENRE